MTSILLAVAVVAGIGLIAGVGLAVAAAAMHVPVDERVEQLTAALPGANCGACGHAGCAAYAEAVAGGAPCNLCTPGGNDAARALAAVMDVEAQAVAERRAFVRCGGAPAHCGLRFDYQGAQSCAAAASLYGGPKACASGCLGLGDCVCACPNGAVYLRDGMARINRQACTGCAVCVARCPNGVIALEEIAGKAVVRCCSQAAGAAVRKQCKAGCIGCKRCEKACPAGAVVLENNLARVDAAKCTGCGLCVGACPTGAVEIV